MKIALYVDDIRRSINDENFRHMAKSLGATVIVEARTYADAIHNIEMHLYDGLINSANIPVLRCHSANPVGRDNIDRVFEAIQTRYMD